MANSTFSGPVRSQNGFQELVDGVWTPIGGGGGAALIASLDVPLTIEFTEIGKMITVVNNASQYPSGTAYTINLSCPLAVPGNDVQFQGKYMGGNSSPPTNYDIGGTNTLVMYPVPFYLQFVLAGVRDLGYGSGLQAFVQLSGWVSGEINGP